MTQTYRKFEASDIPLTIQGNLAVFNWPELEPKLHNNIGQSLFINIMTIVQGVIDDLHNTKAFNEENLKTNIVLRMNTELYPLYCGIKKTSVSSVMDVTPYMETLIDKYGFSFAEAHEILFEKEFTLDKVMTLFGKLAKRVEVATREDILREAIKKFAN